ncbi:MAG: sensor histidine kinase [Robiginitalea sp.]
MKKKRRHQERLADTEQLFRAASDFLLMAFLLLTLVSRFLLGAALPLVAGLLGITVLMGINSMLYRTSFRQPLVFHLVGAGFLLGILGVSLYSGGLQSPFLFLLGLLVLLAYRSKSLYGHLYLGASLLGIAFIWAAGRQAFVSAYNALPESAMGLFTLLVIVLFMAFLGWIFGHRFFEKLHGIYRSKEELEQKVSEKEMLLKEVHHRVKNNLQTVSSLLRMQGRSVEDAQTLSQIRSSQNRVVCMAMVHEMLYQREDLSCIEYSTYVHQLGDYLVKSIKGPESNIRLNINIPEIELGIDTAIPLGLLINEAVTNALKYGFEGRDSGEISISLEKEDKHEFVLRIGDNGVGYPESMDYQSSKSLGLKLIHNLSRQLKGSVIRDLSKRGTNYIIRFQEVRQEPFHSIA